MPDIRMEPVQSSNIAAIGYDEESKTLRIEFNSGATWEYESVSPGKHDALMSASSHGQYFNAHIKNSHAGRRVS